MAFDEPVLGLAIRRSGSEADSVGVEQFSDFAPHKFGVEVALNTTREPASVDEEFPEGVRDGYAVHVFETVNPGLSGGAVHQHEAVRIATWRDPVSIADVHSDGVESFRRPGDAVSLVAPLNVDDAAKGEWRVTDVDDLDACPEGL